MVIKQAGPRSELYAYSPNNEMIAIQHGGLEGLLGKGYLGQPSIYPHEPHWPVASIWSSQIFRSNEEYFSQFIKDCQGTGAHTKIVWECGTEKIFEWEKLSES